MTDIN